MLQEALGGNSSTIMICAIKPGHFDYEETLNVLRYADRAKKIKNTPIINEDANAKMITELKEENERLMKEHNEAGANPEARNAAKEVYEANLAEIEAKSRSWEQQLHATKID